MCKVKCLTPLLCFCVPVVAVADTIKQSVPFDYDANFGPTFPVIQGFDTQGGTRALTGVTFSFDYNFDVEVYIESTGPTPVMNGDFLLDQSYITLYQLGTIDGLGGDPGDDPPLLGPGSFFAGGITGDLAAYDGIPGNDGPDSFRRTFADSFTTVQQYGMENPEVLAAVTDVGPLTTVMGGFGELFFQWINDPKWPPPSDFFPVYPDDAAIWVSTPTFRHYGAIHITYEFTVVPEPLTTVPLTVLALLSMRRR